MTTIEAVREGGGGAGRGEHAGDGEAGVTAALRIVRLCPQSAGQTTLW